MTARKSFADFSHEMFDLYRKNEFEKALELVIENAAAFPQQSPRIIFWRACLLSRCGRKEDVLKTLKEGLDAGLWWHESQFRDSDLDAVRDMPTFQELVALSHKRWAEVERQTEPERTLLVPTGAGPYPLLIALHGHSGNKDHNMEYWQIACQKGWMVLSPQSRNSLFPGSYFWLSAKSGQEDIAFHLDEIIHDYRIDTGRIVMGGFSQGGGMAIQAALSAKIPARGIIGVGTWWEELDSIRSAARGKPPLRGYFISGLKDHALERSREIQAVLAENNIVIHEEVHPEIGHEFPKDFESSFEQAIEFILK